MTLGLDRTRLDGKRFAKDDLVGARARHHLPLRADLDVEIGVDATVDRYDGDPTSPYAVPAGKDYATTQALFSSRTDTATGAWAAATWHPMNRFELTGTARADVFSSAGVTALGPSPRVSTRVPLGSRLTFLGAMGVAPEPPAFAIPVPAVGYRGLPGGLAFGYQKSAGAEVELPFDVSFRAVGFHHTYEKMRGIPRTGEDLYAATPEPAPTSPTQPTAWSCS